MRPAWPVSAAGVVIACAASVTSLAASSYSVRVSASSPVATGHRFSVKARGLATQRALLYVYVTRKACSATTDKEASRVRVYKSGQSYFVQRGGGPRKEPFAYAWVSGSFTNSFTGHAGTTAGREYVCAYLDTANKYGGFRVTSAHASGRYTVTP